MWRRENARVEKEDMGHKKGEGNHNTLANRKYIKSGTWKGKTKKVICVDNKFGGSQVADRSHAMLLLVDKVCSLLLRICLKAERAVFPGGAINKISGRGEHVCNVPSILLPVRRSTVYFSLYHMKD